MPFTGTTVPTGALVFDGVAATTGRSLTSTPAVTIGAGLPGIHRQYRPSLAVSLTVSAPFTSVYWTAVAVPSAQETSELGTVLILVP